MALTSWILFVLFILMEIHNAKSQESVQYLQNAMWDLKNRMNTVQSKRRIDSLQLQTPEMQKDDRDNVPMLSLTKAELAALYEAALNREHSITQSPDDHNTPYVQTVVHELDEESSAAHEDKSNDNHYGQQDTDDADGYYYYYYPINSFMDGISSAHSHQVNAHHNVEEEKIHPQYHSHTHQHNVHITSTKATPEKDKKKGLEPLFMAVSSFIGMAVMFILSIIFLPKFGTPKSRGVKQSGEMTTLVQIVLKAIEGDDCSERVACELGKAAKAFKVHDNRFVKLLRRISPAYVKWYVDGVTKYAQTNLTCTKIQCRRKNAMKPKRVRRKS